MKSMMFQVGDVVIHPGYGAGTVVEIEELQFLGSDKPYYSIELSDGSKTRVWSSPPCCISPNWRTWNSPGRWM